MKKAILCAILFLLSISLTHVYATDKVEIKMGSFYFYPDFITNLKDSRAKRLMRVRIFVEVTQKGNVFLTKNEAFFRDRILLILHNKTFKELKTDPGMTLLKQDILKDINEILKQRIGKAAAEEIAFDHFILE